MKALVITYEGAEVPQHIVDQIVIAMSGNVNRGNVVAVQMDDNDCLNALVAFNVMHREDRDEKVNDDQKAIDAAATYIAGTVLCTSTNPAVVGFTIHKHIAEGDERMKTAVEILATKQGDIREPKFTKSILQSIKAIYQNVL